MARAADGNGFRRLDLVTAAINGSEAFVAAGKFVEIGVLMLCAVYVIDSGERLWLVVLALVVMNGRGHLGDQGVPAQFRRSAAVVLGAHDLAALSTMTLTMWFAHLYSSAGRHRRLAGVAAVVG